MQKLDKAGQVEMRLVAAGARRDMGELDAAIVTLQSPELASNSVQPWTARLRYAYADALLAAYREDEAREWFAKTAEADKDQATDASDRLAELDGVEFVDASLPDDEDDVEGLEAADDLDLDEDADEDDAEVAAAERAADQAEYYDEDDEEYEPLDEADAMRRRGADRGPRQGLTAELKGRYPLPGCTALSHVRSLSQPLSAVCRSRSSAVARRGFSPGCAVPGRSPAWGRRTWTCGAS